MLNLQSASSRVQVCGLLQRRMFLVIASETRIKAVYGEVQQIWQLLRTNEKTIVRTTEEKEGRNSEIYDRNARLLTRA
jgi:hypothetical protein